MKGARPLFLLVLLLWQLPVLAAPDPLLSWREGSNKQAIVEFVNRVASEDSPDFLPAAERVATFDNDGTLWSEQPLYFQAIYALELTSSVLSGAYLETVHIVSKCQRP